MAMNFPHLYYPCGPSDEIHSLCAPPEADLSDDDMNTDDNIFSESRSSYTTDEINQYKREALSMSSEDEKTPDQIEDLPQAKPYLTAAGKVPDDIVDVPNIHSDGLKLLIDKVMKGEEPTDQELQQLPDVQKAVLQSIKEKKACTDEERINKGKRVEEKQKLFFKATLKYSENKYFKSVKNPKKKIKKRQLDQREFYENYFSETAKRTKCDLTNFYHPNKKLKGTPKRASHTPDNKGHAGLKSFNSTYIDLILSSEKFRDDSLEFMENIFVQDYLKTRYQKIDKLLKQIQKIIEVAWQNHLFTKVNDAKEKVPFKESIIQKIRENLLYNPKSKLPWSDSELEEAKLFARQKIQRASGESLTLNLS